MRSPSGDVPVVLSLGRPLTRAIVSVALAYNLYQLMMGLVRLNPGRFNPLRDSALGVLVALAMEVGAVAVGIYALKCIYSFMTGNASRQYPAGNQVLRGLLVGGVVHVAGLALIPGSPGPGAVDLARHPRESKSPSQVQPATPAPVPDSAQALAQHVTRCAFSGDGRTLLLQASDRQVLVLDAATGAWLRDTAPGLDFDRLLDGADVAMDVQGSGQPPAVDRLGAGITYIGPAHTPGHAVVFDAPHQEVRQIDLRTGEKVWGIFFDRSGVRRVQDEIRTRIPADSWNLFTTGTARATFMVINRAGLVKGTNILNERVDDQPRLIALDGLLPASSDRWSIQELTQLPGRPRFLLKAASNRGAVRYSWFEIHLEGGEVKLAVTRTMEPGPNVPVGEATEQWYLPQAGATTLPFLPLTDARQREIQAAPNGFPLKLGDDLFYPSSLHPQLDLVRPGEGQMPVGGYFWGRSFSRDRVCSATDAKGRFLAVALGPEVQVYSRERQGEREGYRVWKLSLNIDAAAATTAGQRP